MGDDQRLDQELGCILCEERLDPADVVEGKSAGSGHSSEVPHSRRRRYCDVLNSDSQVHARVVFPWDEEEFSFTKVECEVMHSRDDFQKF